MLAARACLPHSDKGGPTVRVETLEDALAAYFDSAGECADIPSGDSGYDEERGGWMLENINGALALVRNNGTIIFPVYDEHSGEWVIPY
jgi:hypothetical protein